LGYSGAGVHGKESPVREPGLSAIIINREWIR
jgi:hypothetical protein